MNPQGFQISTWDILIFVVFVVAVVSIGIIQSRSEKGSEDYFLAGRGLSWWLIGFSLIASNISTEQFVGMSGNAASHVGLAIASYEWMAAITSSDGATAVSTDSVAGLATRYLARLPAVSARASSRISVE